MPNAEKVILKKVLQIAGGCHRYNLIKNVCIPCVAGLHVTKGIESKKNRNFKMELKCQSCKF